MDTIDRNDRYTIDSLDGLAKIYDRPVEGVLKKETVHISPVGRAFIERAPFLILATASMGGIDCSPKGDAPGFVQILDDRTLLIPDRPGNNRIDGMKNILANPKVGLIFMIPGANETYRVNGSAKISVDPTLLDRFLVQGKRPRAVIVVNVEQAFNHCPKAFVRSNLWAAGAQGRPAGAPTTGSFAAQREGADDTYAVKYDADYALRMPKQLY